MRILNISPYNFVKGGSDAYFISQNALLRKYGIEVAEFCVANKQNQESVLQRYFPRGINLERPGMRDAFKFIYSLDAKKSIREAIRAFQPDLVHLHIYYGNFTSSILQVIKGEFGLPVVQTVHDYKLVCPVYSLTRNGNICEECRVGHFTNALKYRCNRGSLLRSAITVAESYVSYWAGNIGSVDRLIAVSSFQGERLAALGVPEEKIRVLLNFMDADRFTPRTHASSKARFLYFGRIEESKGVLDIIQAASALPQYDFLFAGTGSASGMLEKEVKKLGIRNVQILGFVGGDALHDLVRSCTATILVPFVYENCPMSVLESFALGVPVIGSRMGGIPELVSNAENGIIVTPGDKSELVSAIRYLGESADTSFRFGENGRRKVETVFSGETHFWKMMDLYAELGMKTPVQMGCQD